MDVAHLRVDYRHVCSPFLMIVCRILDGTTSEEPPLYQFVQDWRNELQLLITRPGKFVSRYITLIIAADSRTSDCRLIEYKTTELVVEGYTRTFILLEFIVQQVLNELVSHLGLFGDLHRTHQVLVMVSLALSCRSTTAHK